MQHSIDILDISTPAIAEIDVTTNEFYDTILQDNGLNFSRTGVYLVVGNVLPGCWIIDISVLITQLRPLLNELMPYLKTKNVPFAIPENAGVALQLFSADFGYEQLGKIISIFPKTPHQADDLAKYLVQLTQSIKGPAIPSDTFLGGSVYTRHSTSLKIPFELPSAIPWPFSFISAPKKSKEQKILVKKYLITDTVKADVKGNVYKGMVIDKWWQLKFSMCIIKQGKKDMSYDQYRRTIKDRLRLQATMQNDLQIIAPLPKTIEYFELNGDSYLVMEYIEGKSLHDLFKELSNGRCWWAMELVDRLLLLNYLIEICNIVKHLHLEGFIHRDLSPVNFLIDAKGKLTLIDLELCYNEKLFGDLPPFSYGTAGFMSPEQQIISKPTVHEDAYALGSLMISIIAGIHPTKLQVEDPNILLDHLHYLIQDQPMSTLITRCHSFEPCNRPSIDQILQTLQNYFMRIGQQDALQLSIYLRDNIDLTKLIQRHIQAYASNRLANANKLWFSGDSSKHRYVANSSHTIAFLPGFYRGISGVLFTLTLLRNAGHDLNKIEEEIMTAWSWLQHNYFDGTTELLSGLYEGSHGLALNLAFNIHAGTITDNGQTRSYVKKLLSPSTGLNLASGVAGQGLAILSCKEYIDDTFRERALKHCIDKIASAQQRDGSWLFPKDGAPSKNRKYTGLSCGAAGVILFLLEHYRLTHDQKIKTIVERALLWLHSTRIETTESTQWPLHEQSRSTDWYMEIGNAGIVLVFLKAYEILKNHLYLAVAEKALASYPLYLSSDNLGIMDGITGLGLVFLRAYLLTQNPAWHQRATHITNLIISTSVKPRGEDYSSWFTVNSSMRTASFLNGNTGIAYYLVHYNNPALLHQSIIF